MRLAWPNHLAEIVQVHNASMLRLGQLDHPRENAVADVFVQLAGHLLQIFNLRVRWETAVRVH